jgi:hypothetical protein
MFRKIVVGLLAIVTGFSMVVYLQPNETLVTRSIAVAAPAPAVFDQVNTLRNWDGWSPWAKLDPNAKNSFEGPQAGTGAGFAWSGNAKVGEGRMKIVDSRPGERVHVAVDFVRPFEGKSTSEFSFKPEGDKTTVTWQTRAHNNFVAKAVGLFMNPEKMLGPDMEKGLAQLKTVAETPAKPQ